MEDMAWLGPRIAEQRLPEGVSGGLDSRAQAVGKGLGVSRTLAEKTRLGQKRAAWDEPTVV